MISDLGRMVLVEPSGRLLPDQLHRMHVELSRPGKEMAAALILDLTSISDFTTASFRAIIKLKMTLRDIGCKLILTGMQDELRSRFTSLGMDLIFPLHLSKGDVLWGKLGSVERLQWAWEEDPGYGKREGAKINLK